MNLINSQQNIISGIKHEWIFICKNLFFEKSNFSKFLSCLIIYLFLCDIFYVYSILNSISAYKIILFFHRFVTNIITNDTISTNIQLENWKINILHSTYLKIFNLQYSQAWKSTNNENSLLTIRRIIGKEFKIPLHSFYSPISETYRSIK